MGDVRDNRYLFVHRQDGVEKPDVGLRFHRGDEGIDMTTLIPLEEARLLKRLSSTPNPLFGTKLRSVAFTLIAGIPTKERQDSAVEAYRQLFCDFKSL